MDNYDLELDRIVDVIREKQAKMVCIQLPDGLKPESKKIVDYIREHTEAEILIWAGSNFGACDIPQIPGVDLLVHFGHSVWR